MKFEEYRDIYVQLLNLDDDFEPVEIPMDKHADESPEEALIRFLADHELIEVNGNSFRIADREAIEKVNPNIMKLLDAVMMASAFAELDALEEEGLVFMTADEDGNICYELTERGYKELK
jgi:hypothetical protein